jgi:NitT/TauT family transport system substrate-binding protein
MCQSEPQSTQAITAGFGNEIVKPYDTPLREPVRMLVMTEKLAREKPDVALRVMKCFVDATRTLIANPKLASKYVREQMFKGQLSEEEYRAAPSNAALTSDITAEYAQITTDLMVKYGVGKLQKPPRAADWVKLDLLKQAKAELGVH